MQPTATGIALDSDGDGLSDELEALVGANPQRTDTDGDGCSDLAEHTMGWPLNEAPDPNQPDHCICLEGESSADRDGDGLNDCEENFILTAPGLPDTDLDGVVDQLEVVFGTYPILNDVNSDPDLDDVLNGQEIRQHRSTGNDDNPRP